MNQDETINELDRNKVVFESLLTNSSEKHVLWKPTPDKWCLLEIVCHLYDEEREDFRARVKHCLELSDLPFSPIDPAGWVTDRNYLAQNYTEVLQGFLRERTESVSWLRSFVNPDWSNTRPHPTLGNLSADDFLSNWLAHDYIHIRQIIKLKYTHHDKFSDRSLSYAGNW